MDNVISYYVKAAFESNKEEKYEGKSCILLVSVGQKYHEGDRLFATIDLINKSGFGLCTIAVADTLQRHNFLDQPSDKAYEISLEMGKAWLERNKHILNRLKPQVKILKWDEALQEEKYADLRNKIEKEYELNKHYQEAINATINMFIERFKKRDASANLDLIFSNCLKYLIEECPIIMPLWASQGYDYIIYPKPMTTAMSTTRDIFVTPNYNDKSKWLSLKFKKLSQPVYTENYVTAS